MAKYTINYACGHGSIEKQLFGPHKDRDSKIEWMEANMVCPDCYKAAQKAKDSTAEKTAKICLVPALEPIISIEVSGQIETNKDALYTLGYRWSDSNKDGLFGYFSTHRPQRVLAILCKIESIEQVGAWMETQKSALGNIGYIITSGLNDLDLAYLSDTVKKQDAARNSKEAAIAKLAEIKAADPKPAVSALRNRIAELEKSSGQKWNGKIYGKKGYYNFYVNNEKYIATDAEVADREAVNAAREAWDEKYKTEIAAAK